MNTLNQESQTRLRAEVRVRGIVQGVGFRPFVYALALELGLSGWVRNDGDGVGIEVEGTAKDVDSFLQRLQGDAPPLARVESVEWTQIASTGQRNFHIEQTASHGARGTLIPPDTGICEKCLAEMFDPRNRRYHYPFINCTNCGPRFTIIRDLPYDRPFTTMSGFTMCSNCQREYADPSDRRFHAQPNSCWACGPRLRLLVGREEVVGVDPIQRTAELLNESAIVAIKGIGGYHLAGNAQDGEAVALLRRRKRREEKPFAVMVPDLAAAEALCVLSDFEVSLLRSPRRPIVIVERRTGCPLSTLIAPGQQSVGIMLPYTPLHYLLLEAFRDVRQKDGHAALVMTSGNVSDEPIAYEDSDAVGRLQEIADAVLIHDRAIHTRCDDSVVRIAADAPMLLRRSRGYVPEPITLAFGVPIPILAVGGHLKNTFCLAVGRNAFLSHHIGDLDTLETLKSFREGVDHFCRLCGVEPRAIAHDLHPDYLSSQEASAFSISRTIAVQHHHAHIASVLAEHGLEGPLIGIAADGTGYGGDGSIWGGEVLIADSTRFDRLAHLETIPLPGGEQAVKQPWRVAAAYLERVYGPSWLDLDLPMAHHTDRSVWEMMRQMIARGVNCPMTSSLGRLFDAVSALLGLRRTVAYEGQAAIELEALAFLSCHDTIEPYPFVLLDTDPAQIVVSGMIRAIVDDLCHGKERRSIAFRFHRTVVAMLVKACTMARERTGLSRVALSGGVFQNRLVLERTLSDLESAGFTVFRNRLVPANDGGLSLGQAVVAASRLSGERM